MTGRLAIDFGTSNTVIAVWDENRQDSTVLHIPDYGKISQQGSEQFSVIPSLIHYLPGERRWIGNQVLQHALYHDNRTFRWMKRYILNRSPLQMCLDDRLISQQQAGKDFLSSVMLLTAEEFPLTDEEIALTVPVESFEHYEDWLAVVAESAHLPRFRLIDEPSAAALGYGAHIQSGDVYLIFDFGGGTVHAAIVLVQEEDQARSGRRCRVLGKAGLDMGGTTIDQWLFQEVLRRNQRSDSDDPIRSISSALLVECEALKERLSFQEQASLRVANLQEKTILEAEFTRAQFEELLDQHDAFARLDRTIRRALQSAQERGYGEENIKAVLMVGGGSQIPSIQNTLRRIFGRERVLLTRPLDAIARGAAAFIAGVDFFDHIQHDYAIRFVNRARGDYDYRVIVPRGTPYPTHDPLALLTVKATYDGQTQLGIAIYEMGERHPQASAGGVELVFDPSGAARVMPVAPDEEERRRLFWMNETNPTFLKADPPARQGEERFEVEFSIDGNKRLLITARDLPSGKITLLNAPVVKLV
ncbi:MAG: Hsp70 family protein [Anaerolineales bacterium]|nr:Hsp70 family protein [Anaerolineales bacterium]